MLINISTKVLLDLKLTPNEYLFLYLIQNKSLPTLRRLLKTTNFITFVEIKHLMSKGFVKNVKYNIVDLKDLTVTNIFLNYFKKNTDSFEELIEKFPIKVTRPDGKVDYLRTSLTYSKQLYRKIIKNDSLIHNHILECLEYEKKHREKENTFKYMKRLSNWLKTEEWKTFEKLMTEDHKNRDDKIDNSYGTKIL